MEQALVLSNVTKRYGRTAAVDEFSLAVPPGQILGFVGRNGAGKTTTIRMIMSIIYPDSGTVEVLGRPRAIDVKDRVGYLPEERGLYRKMTVAQTLMYFGRLKGLGKRALRDRISGWLRLVELGDWEHKPVETLSKGMQQKLQFLSTILHAPDLVILDEPFSGLDPINLNMLKELMFALRQRGTTVIFSTHLMDQAEQLCDRLVLINRGRKIIEGTMNEIQSGFCERILSLEGEGEFQSLASVPGVLRAEATTGRARIEIGEQTDPNEILRHALQTASVSRFDVQRPNLHEIFVKLVGEDAPPETAQDEAPRAEDSIDKWMDVIYGDRMAQRGNRNG